jgi:hypothetical protein
LLKQLFISEKKLPFGSFSFENGTVFPVHTWHFEFMDKKADNSKVASQQGRHEHPLPQEISEEQKKLNVAAHDEAEKDMEDDAELTASSPNDDLDEGESARLGEETELI